MKNLISYIKESLLDDEDVLMKDTGDKAIKNEILKFLKENYFQGDRCKISKKPINGKYIVDCNTSLEVKNKNITSLTNEYFEFGVVNGNFNCLYCDFLTTLKGAPKKVGGDFYCYRCSSLTTLKGAPKEVGRDFYCTECKQQFNEKDVKNESKVNGKIIC